MNVSDAIKRKTKTKWNCKWSILNSQITMKSFTFRIEMTEWKLKSSRCDLFDIDINIHWWISLSVWLKVFPLLSSNFCTPSYAENPTLGHCVEWQNDKAFLPHSTDWLMFMSSSSIFSHFVGGFDTVMADDFCVLCKNKIVSITNQSDT